MRVSLYLKRPGAISETAIIARICYDGNQLKYYIPLSIKPQHWNKKTNTAKETKSFDEYREFNYRLNNIESVIKNVFRRYQNDNNGETPLPDTLKELLDAEIRKTQAVKPKQITLFEYIEKFIERSKEGTRMNIKTKKPTVKGTNKGFTTTYHRLKDFQAIYKKPIDFDTIDIDFYNEFVKYLMHDLKFRYSTIGDNIKRL